VRPHLKTAHHNKRAGGVAQHVGPEFKPHYCKKEKDKVLGYRYVKAASQSYHNDRV
jgi:hypothetical protein